jgi:uncharacterized protein (DUF2345 family)
MKKKFTLTIFAIFCCVCLSVFAAYESLNYSAPGGGQWVIGGALDVASGGTLTMESGSTLTLENGYDVTLGDGGDVTIESGAAIDVESGGAVDIQNGADIDIESGGGLDVNSGGDIDVESGGGIDVVSGGDIDIATGGALDVNSGGDVDIESGGTMAVNSGGALDIESGGALKFRGTAFSGASVCGMHAVTAGEASANAAVIATGITVPAGMFFQIFRTNVDVHSDAIVSFAGGNLTVADGGATYVVTEGDVISWLLIGY